MSRTLLLVLWAILSAGSATAQWAETEPNNQLTDAGVKTITSNGLITGQLLSFDADIFRIASGAKGTINLQYNTGGSGIPVQLFQVGNATPLASATPTFVLTYTLDETKSYYLRTAASAVGGTYVMTLTGIDFSTLPVGLESFSATLQNGALKVDWTTLSEKNNSRFIVQASLDGQRWSDLAIVASKAVGGNSSGVLNYSVSAPFGGMALAGMGLLGLLLLPSARNRWLRLAMCVLVVGVVAGCAKEQAADNQLDTMARSKGPVYVRLAQVDLDGTINYSQVLVAKR